MDLSNVLISTIVNAVDYGSTLHQQVIDLHTRNMHVSYTVGFILLAAFIVVLYMSVRWIMKHGNEEAEIGTVMCIMLAIIYVVFSITTATSLLLNAQDLQYKLNHAPDVLVIQTLLNK